MSPAVQYSIFCLAKIYCANLIVLVTDHLNSWHQKLYMVERESNLITYYILQQIKRFYLSNLSHHLAKNTKKHDFKTCKINFKPYGFGTNVKYKKDTPCCHLSNDISLSLFEFIISKLRENYLGLRHSKTALSSSSS
jgi:hypothetical protein